MRSGYFLYRMVDRDEATRRQSEFNFSSNMPKFQGKIPTPSQLEKEEIEDEISEMIKKRGKKHGIWMSMFWDGKIIRGTTRFHDMRWCL